MNLLVFRLFESGKKAKKRKTLFPAYFSAAINLKKPFFVGGKWRIEKSRLHV
jgi:hypothetical protein